MNLRRRNLLGIAALVACLLATAATSPFKVVHPRSYPLWRLSNAATTVGPIHLAAWVSKSGKGGVGVTVMAERCGENVAPPRFEVAKAELQVEQSETFVAKPARAVQAREPRAPASQPASRPASQPASQPASGPAEPPPPFFTRTFFYVAFAFDNEALWNDDRNRARLVLYLELDGRPFTWTLDARQTRKGYHRAVGFGAPPPCPRAPTRCPKPDILQPESQPTSAPASQPAGTVLEQEQPGGEVRP